MLSKKQRVTNFNNFTSCDTCCIRPNSEKQLLDYMRHHQPPSVLTRGSGLSYNECCFNSNGLTIDTRQLNHFISFDPSSAIAVCQAGVTFHDLLYLNHEYIPPVLPGTLHATIAGGIANDVHGKNNPHAYSLGHHIEWLELFINNQLMCCSRTEHSNLFFATIGGLGLTGIITRLAIRLKKATPFVRVEHQQFKALSSLLEQMTTQGLSYDYQVAWLDLLHSTPRAVLSLARHCEPISVGKSITYSIPKVPFSVIKKWNMNLFNKYYFHHKKAQEFLSLASFNNPLDKINHWNYLYGSSGLVQFQAVFAEEIAHSTLLQLIQIINRHKAVPTLAVLKLFQHASNGLLSFCIPGFTLAIDFINNKNAHQAIKEMNQLITEINGKLYLAKDLFLTPKQYQRMYKKHTEFAEILTAHNSPMRSDLARRLGIIQ